MYNGMGGGEHGVIPVSQPHLSETCLSYTDGIQTDKRPVSLIFINTYRTG